MDDVACIVTERASLPKRKPAEETLGLFRSEQRPGEEEQTCGRRAFQMPGEISSVRGGGTLNRAPWSWGRRKPLRGHQAFGGWERAAEFSWA